MTNYTDLKLRIEQLKEERIEQEIILKNSLNELVYSISPASMIKESLHNLAKDKEVQVDLTKVGLNWASKFIIDKIFGKNKSEKGLLTSTFAEAITSSLINNNAENIVSGISSLFHQKEDEETDE